MRKGKPVKVGSVSVVCADEWLATASANRQVQGSTVGNPFADANSLLKESRRQKGDDSISIFALPIENTKFRPSNCRLPGLYWDDENDHNFGNFQYTDENMSSNDEENKNE
uniref:Uncharacterized protein n=1 Tax=Aureoumbra lagunensis TaxID=44058 RepID=A0A7S3NPT5_9STRA|mmetsp:Transcript_23230/g.30084  ORF Transcript_23230/g.30084 Transcript_23230/m.30084 type:complete len:111 (-) Transcript_23230:156-488(-)